MFLLLLRHSQKLESVAQLAAGIANETNTPAQFLGDTLAFLAERFGGMEAMRTRYRCALADLGGPHSRALGTAEVRVPLSNSQNTNGTSPSTAVTPTRAASVGAADGTSSEPSPLAP